MKQDAFEIEDTHLNISDKLLKDLHFPMETYGYFTKVTALQKH